MFRLQIHGELASKVCAMRSTVYGKLKTIATVCVELDSGCGIIVRINLW